MTTASTIATFELLPGVNGVVNALLKLLNRNDDRDADVSSTVHYMKAVIDGYINEVEGDNRKCIEGGKDVFYIWVYHKVIMYRYKESATETATATEGDEQYMAVENSNRTGLDGEEIGKHDDVAKRKNQFSQHMEDLEVVINQPNFTAASLRFTSQYVPVCGQTFLKIRDRVRDGRGNEKTASYYCPCGKKDDLYFQLRHNDVSDVKMVNNEKRYVFRCFTKPGYSKLVAQHFQRKDRPDPVCHEKTQTYASATGTVAEGMDTLIQGGNTSMRGEDECSILRPAGDKERILREGNENMKRKEVEKRRKNDVGMVTTGQTVMSELNNSINKRGRAEKTYPTFRGKKCNVDNVSDSNNVSINECKEQVCLGTSTATKRIEVESDSEEDDHETTEAFLRFRTQLSVSHTRERKVTEL